VGLYNGYNAYYNGYNVKIGHNVKKGYNVNTEYVNTVLTAEFLLQYTSLQNFLQTWTNFNATIS